MSLSKRIDHGKLIYYTRTLEAFSIIENTHYRWMTKAGIIQSLMYLSHPYRVTLPHQVALLLPLLFIRPINILELGLGGGNLARFILSIAPNITFTSIENDPVIIDCFSSYFNPDNVHLTVHQNNANNQLIAKSIKTDWVIYDIYQSSASSSVDSLEHACSYIEKNQDVVCLSINIPQGIGASINDMFSCLQPYIQSYNIFYFSIPNYKNTVVHLVSKNIDTNCQHLGSIDSYLPSTYQSYWSRYWKNSKRVAIN